MNDPGNEPGQGTAYFPEIELLEPAEGELTAPLQRFRWPDESMWHDPSTGKEENWKRYLAENDRSLPRAVRFHWNPPGVGPLRLHYDLAIAQTADFQDARVIYRLSKPHAEVYNLMVGKEYFWKVTAREVRPMMRGEGKIIAQSGIGRFVTSPVMPRWLRVPGITNVRDVGGWALPDGRRVRQGMLFRGSEMNSHCEISEEGRRVLITNLGIRTDLDLRGLGEECQAVLDREKVDYVNIPLGAYDLIGTPEFAPRYLRLFKLLADPARYPIYMHCWGGADRTGTVAFLLNALLGVSPEDLYTDYELTTMSIWGERSRTGGDFQELIQTLALFGAEGSTLQSQVEYYLRVIGLPVRDMQVIKEIFSEF